MPFTVFKGIFLPSFGQPDGDSVRFIPDDPAPLFRLARLGRGPKLNPQNGSIQLRYEGIDTLEKHAIQPFANDALSANLRLIGSNDDRLSAPGWFLSNRLDNNGRPIAFVFAGDPPVADGSSHWLDPETLRSSVNYKLVEEGFAYPLFYDTLFGDLRDAIAEASIRARANPPKGASPALWAHDATLSGATWTGSAATLPPIFPKLWRRIETAVRDPDYFSEQSPLGGIARYIEREKPERVLVLPLADVTGFDNVVEVTNTTVKLMYAPHELVFQP